MSEPLYEGRAVGQSRHGRRADMHFADPSYELPREALNGSASRDRARHEKDGRSRIWSKQGAVAVVDEREKERDRHTPWLHREVQGRVAGPLVQLRFISLIPCSGANQR